MRPPKDLWPSLCGYAGGALLDALVSDKFAIAREPGETDEALRERVLDLTPVVRTVEEE